MNKDLSRIFQNDDTGAFRSENEYFLKINRPKGLGDNVVITKVELKCGNLPIMTFGDGTEAVTFPIGVNLTATQTKGLEPVNNCYVKCYDVNGLGKTCIGTIQFIADRRVI